MPIYEYQCEACGHSLEKIQKMSDSPLKDCPDCGEAELKKLVSAAAFRLKGDGWYETDFKTGKKKNVLHGADSAGADKKTATSSGKDGSKSSSGAETSKGSHTAKKDKSSQSSGNSPKKT